MSHGTKYIVHQDETILATVSLVFRYLYTTKNSIKKLTNVVHVVLSNFSSFFRCLPACLRKIDKLFTGITAMTEAVFSDVGPRKLSSRSSADGVSMLSKTRTFPSALSEEDDAHVPVSGCDRRNLW